MRVAPDAMRLDSAGLTHQQILAPDAMRLDSARATPLPRMLPRAERFVTALEKSKMMKATVDRIVCAHHDNQLT